MKIEISRMYDAVKALEIEEIKSKLRLCGGSFEFDPVDNYQAGRCPQITVSHNGDMTNVIVLNVSIGDDGEIHMTTVRNDAYDKDIIEVERNGDYPYGALSVVAEQICLPMNLYVSMSCLVEGSKEQMGALLSGDRRKSAPMLLEMKRNGQVFIEGDARVAAEDIKAYNKEYGTDYPERDLKLF